MLATELVFARQRSQMWQWNTVVEICMTFFYDKNLNASFGR